MKKVEIKGIIPPIITPMNEDETINETELRNQVNRQIRGGRTRSVPIWDKRGGIHTKRGGKRAGPQYCHR